MIKIVAALLALLSLLLVAYGLQYSYLWLPPCGWHSITHLPCPFCGSTRALAALGQGHLIQALFLNPLTSIIFITTTLGLTIALGQSVLSIKKRPISNKTLNLPRLFLTLALINWIYLLWSF